MCGFDKPGGKTRPLRGFNYYILLQIRPQPSRRGCLSPSPSPPKGAGSIEAPPLNQPPPLTARPRLRMRDRRQRGRGGGIAGRCCAPSRGAAAKRFVFFSPSAVAERRPPSSSQAAPPALTVSRGGCPGTGSSSPRSSLPPAGRACAASAPPLAVALREKRAAHAPCGGGGRGRRVLRVRMRGAGREGQGGLVGACWGRVPSVPHLLRAGVGLKVLQLL